MLQLVSASALPNNGMQPVDVVYDEAIRRTVDGVSPLAWILPLQVQLNAIADDRCVLRIKWTVLEHQAETEPFVEVYGKFQHSWTRGPGEQPSAWSTQPPPW